MFCVCWVGTCFVCCMPYSIVPKNYSTTTIQEKLHHPPVWFLHSTVEITQLSHNKFLGTDVAIVRLSTTGKREFDEWSYPQLLLLWALSDARITELWERPLCFNIKLHSETQVSGRLGMSEGTTLAQCWINAGSLCATMAQHYTDIGSASCLRVTDSDLSSLSEIFVLDEKPTGCNMSRDRCSALVSQGFTMRRRGNH